jgi:ubiquinone/menaquinone biosynthesis C-methylase UbiE
MTAPDFFKTHHEPPAQRLDLVIGVVAGFITALAVRHSLGKASTWIDIVGAALLGFFASYWIRREVMLPKGAIELDTADASELARSIQEAEYASYAISSDWIDLWRSDAFTYYLSLDQVASLAIYTRRQHSPLKGLTESEVARREFVTYCRTLMQEVAEENPPLGEHRMRILIYPRAVYEAHKDRFVNLLRLHSAGRIPCIPLISEDLENELSPGECRAIAHLTTGTLDQSLLSKIPPQPRRVHYQLRRNVGKTTGNGTMTFPDLLLIDPTDVARGQLWWYSKGSVRHLSASDHRTDIDAAYFVFRTLCAKGASAVWTNFGSNNIGNVPITTHTGRDANELFFALTYYRDWLSWIKANGGTDPSAAALAEWLAGESRRLEKFARDAASPAGDVHMLDVGCGFGRHLIDLASTMPRLTGLGVDIIPGMVAEAAHDARMAGLDGRLYFCQDDAVLLETCRDDEFDAAICMTNTLGNLEEGKAPAAIGEIYRTLKPGGQLLISVYSAQSVAPRLASYRNVKLHVKETGKSIEAAEGLQSSYVYDSDLRKLLPGEQFQVISLAQLAGIGWTVQARKR